MKSDRVTRAGFPHGLRCSVCLRRLRNGRRYYSIPDGMTDDGDPVDRLVCRLHSGLPGWQRRFSARLDRIILSDACHNTMLTVAVLAWIAGLLVLAFGPR